MRQRGERSRAWNRSHGPRRTPSLARTPEPPYWAVIFSARRNAQPGDQFAETDAAHVDPRRATARLPRRRDRGRRHRDHGLLLGRRGVDRGVEAQRRPRVRAVRRPHTLVRRLRAAGRARRARAQLRPGRAHEPDRGRRPNASSSTTAPTCAGSRVDDADAVARAVGESLEHLKPWMPWADAQSADVTFQRNRLRQQTAQRERGEEWQYGLFASPTSALLGAFGLMTRKRSGHARDRLLGARRRGRPRLRDARQRAPSPTPACACDGIERMIIVLRRGQRPQRGDPATPRLHARTRRDARARGARRERTHADLGPRQRRRSRRPLRR